MKYPQLVSMPSAVSDWLEEQLEARGIDAVVYTRYVLSLLHRDTLDLVSTDQDLHQIPKKCGIESLVDELCEKLKHFESPESPPSPPRDCPSSRESPGDLARRYYAAFPPLSSCSANLLSLIAQRKQQQPRRRKDHTDDMKARKRHQVIKGKKEYGFARSMEQWETGLNRMGDEGYSTSDTTSEIDQSESGKSKNIDETHLAKLVAKFDRRIEALWNTEEEQNQENEYHDLPVDLQELLSSPTKQTVEILNVANKRASDKPKAFIQCGTNITSSIWTDCSEDDSEKSLYNSISYCNLYNEALETYPEKILGDQFNSLSVAADKLVAENETNMLFESFNKENNNFASLPWEIAFPSGNFNNKKWSDDSYNFNSPLRNITRAVNDSLITLNHNKEASCFREVVPKQVLGLPSFTTLPKQEMKPVEQELSTSKEEEDLLTSTRTHFRPIKQESVEPTHATGQYADGTTFAIRSSLEHVNYRRSESGTLYLESGFDSPKKYMEYRVKDDGNKCDTDNESCYSIEKEFVLKFCVKQNEKCCQTELPEEMCQSQSPLEVPAKKRVLCDPEEFFFPGDEELLSDSVDSCECSCSKSRAKLATNLEPLFNASSELCTLHGNKELAEINWSSNWKKCDKCNNDWSTFWPKSELSIDTTSLQQIWSSSEELCRSCLGVPAGSGPQAGRSLEYFKLREELSEDGEQLLSDLSCLQRVYMEQLPNSEVSYDLNDSVCVVSASKERKRRHSSSQKSSEAPATTVARNSWTNASCLKGSVSVFTPPLLRPVTL